MFASDQRHVDIGNYRLHAKLFTTSMCAVARAAAASDYVAGLRRLCRQTCANADV